MSQSNLSEGERGAALAVAILILGLLSAVALGVLAVATADVKIAGSDLKRTQACYASAAAIEMMTNDFSDLFARTSRPTQAQLDIISNNHPTALTTPSDATDIAYTFPDHKLEVNAAAVAALGTNTKPTIPYGPFVGMYASLKPYTLTTTARSSMAECKLTREMNNYLIPLFQFGMFSANDIELNPGQDFFFNGRVHANGNVYATGKMKFLDKVTTANEFIYDVMRNGNTFRASPTHADIQVSMTMKTTLINVPITMGSMVTGPRISTATATPVGQRGYYPLEADGTTQRTKLGTINGTWDATSVMPATGTANRFFSQLLTRSTGAALLQMPLQLDNHSTRELIKRRMPNDSPDLSDPSPLSDSRYHTKSQIRILIDDESPAATDESGIPSGQGVPLSTFVPDLLPNKALSTSPTADGGGRALWRIKDDNTSIATSYNETATSFVRQYNNGGTLTQAETVRSVKAGAVPSAPLDISDATNVNPIVITTNNPHGFLTNDQVFISGVLGNTNANGLYTITVTSPTKFSLTGRAGNSSYSTSTTDKAYGVTRIKTALYNALPSTGNAQRIPAGAGIQGRILIQIVNGTSVRDVTREILSMGMTEGEPNAIVQLQRPLWAAFTQGSRDADNASKSGPYTGDSNYTDCLTGIFANTHIGAIGETNGTGTLDGTFSYLTDIVAPATGQPIRSDSPSFVALKNSDWGLPIWAAAKDWNAIVPINTYNVREGLINQNLTQNAIYERGITSIVEINMRNLARWVEGVYDNNLLAGTNAVSANIANPDGFTVYVSDRRGDDVRSLIDWSGDSIMSSNGMVDNADFYGWNETLNPGEDVQETGSLVKIMPLEIPDPDISPAWDSTPSFGTDRTKRAIEVAAWSNPTNYFRRAVRLFNAEDLLIKATGGILSANKGITMATENMLYVWGNYNTTGITGQPNTSGTPTGSTLNEAGTNRYLGNQIPASIVADAFFPLSKTWFDAGTSLYPDDVLKRQADQGNTVVGQETSMRMGIIAGNNLAALAGTPDAGQGTATGITDSRANGGVNNFPRFLESWYDSSGEAVRFNLVGSLIPLFRSTQALGPFNTSAIFKAPARNWAFDTTFNDPDKLPPGTPMFQYISPTAFRQVL